MQICVAGKNSIAVDGASYLLEKYPHVKFYACVDRQDTGKNTWQPSFLKFAREHGMEVVPHDQLYDVEDLLFFSFEYERLIPPARFKTPYLYNIHFSLLPAYKGMYTSAWPILNGEKESGVTLHKIDRGVDTGDIIAQARFEIASNDTARNVYYKYLHHGTRLVIENVDKIIAGDFDSIPQSAAGSTYYSKKSINFSDLQVDINQTADNIQRQIRAFTFREYQIPMVHGSPISRAVISDSRSRVRPGTLLSDNEDRLTVATVDYDVVLYKDFYDQLIDACKTDDADTAAKILPHMNEINANEKHGWTPLIIAAYHGSAAVCSLLIQAGANPNRPNLNGTTPLMYARHAAERTGNLDVLRCLLNAGAKILDTDYLGKSIIDYAREDQQFHVVNFLESTAIRVS